MKKYVFKIVRAGLRFIRNRLITSVLVFLSLLNFKLRKYLFGFKNACNFLRSVNEPAVIPILKSEGASIGLNTSIESGSVFHNCESFSLLTIGNHCNIGKGGFFDLRDRITIGNNVVIAMNFSLMTHIDIGSSKLGAVYPANQVPIRICDDVYVGSNATILMGVTIGTCAFVASNSLVRDNVESSTMVAGVPAIRKKRIDVI